MRYPMRREEIERRLTMWLEAEETVLVAGQSYETSGGRKLTRANLKEIQAGIALWERRLKEFDLKVEGKNTRRSFRVIPRDL